MRGWGREGRRQSNISAYSRAKRKHNIWHHAHCLAFLNISLRLHESTDSAAACKRAWTRWPALWIVWLRWLLLAWLLIWLILQTGDLIVLESEPANLNLFLMLGSSLIPCRTSWHALHVMLSGYFHTYHMQIIIGTAPFLYLDPFTRHWLLSLYYYIAISVIIVRYDLTWVSLYDTICYKYNFPW